MVSKFKPKLNLKFMLKESKTIKIMKGIRGLTQGKATQFFLAHKQTRNIYVL